MIPVISIVGYSNSGKTTVVEKLVRVLKQRGHRVGVVKHAAHGYEVDVPGKDSRRFYEAGADRIVVAGPRGLTIHERYPQEPTLPEILQKIIDVDLILVEGFKSEPGPKIEVYRAGYSASRLDLGSDLVAVVSDSVEDTKVPCFSPEQAEEIVEYLILVTLNRQMRE